jgi:hypothetical protein
MLPCPTPHTPHPVQAAFHMDLSPTLALDYPTTEAIAGLIHGRLGLSAVRTYPSRRRRPMPAGGAAVLSSTTAAPAMRGAVVVGMAVRSPGQGGIQGAVSSPLTLGQLDAVGPVPYQRWEPEAHAHMHDQDVVR